MKFTSLISMPALNLISALALSVPLGAQTLATYTITDLGPAGNPFSEASFAHLPQPQRWQIVTFLRSLQQREE